jgi:hypothetical protein
MPASLQRAMVQAVGCAFYTSFLIYKKKRKDENVMGSSVLTPRAVCCLGRGAVAIG